MSQNRSPATAHNDGDIVEQEGITHSLCWTPTGDQAELLNSRNGHGNGDVQPTVLNAHPKRAYWDWTASVKSEKYELGRSFSVPFFLGEVPEDPRFGSYAIPLQAHLPSTLIAVHQILVSSYRASSN